MKVRKLIAGMTAASVLSIGALAAPADAAHRPTQSQSAGAVGGLVAAVVQAQVTDVTVVEVGDVDVDVALTNVLNNNRILTNFLNENDVNIEDVVNVTDVTIVGDSLVISVLSAPVIIG